jgi:hypothetical protein
MHQLQPPRRCCCHLLLQQRCVGGQLLLFAGQCLCSSEPEGKKVVALKTGGC